MLALILPNMLLAMETGVSQPCQSWDRPLHHLRNSNSRLEKFLALQRIESGSFLVALRQNAQLQLPLPGQLNPLLEVVFAILVPCSQSILSEHFRGGIRTGKIKRDLVEVQLIGAAHFLGVERGARGSESSAGSQLFVIPPCQAIFKNQRNQLNFVLISIKMFPFFYNSFHLRISKLPVFNWLHSTSQKI